MIGEGSELLLLVPSMAGLVGGVVLPLLGAVPDGGKRRRGVGMDVLKLFAAASPMIQLELGQPSFCSVALGPWTPRKKLFLLV